MPENTTDPAKIDSCVQEVMKEQGVSEEKAWAICTAALKAKDNKMFFDRAIPIKNIIDNITGFLNSGVVLARVGVQDYFGYELGLTGRAMKKVGVYRPAAEVFSADSLKTFINLIVTDDHPTELVTVDNVKKLQVGQVSNVQKDKDVIRGVITVTDKKTLKRIKDGKVEVSVGYTNELVQQKGTFEGKKYEFVQTDIRANHLSIVDNGRCGKQCKLTLDKGVRIMNITIDGINYQVDNEQLGQAINKLQKAHDAKVEKLEKELDEKEKKGNFKKEFDKCMSDQEEMKSKLEKAKAAKDAAIADTLDAEALNTLVSDRAELISQAKDILQDKMLDCTDCPVKIKSAVIEKVFKDFDLKDKSTDYIDAAFDMAIIKYKKAQDSLKKLGGDIISKDGKAVTRDSIREKYFDDVQNAHKKEAK